MFILLIIRRLVSLLELAEAEPAECTSLVLCIDRQMEALDKETLLKNLAWIGFEITTMAPWTGLSEVSDCWLLLKIDT